jgi:hypothetical protein
MTQSPWASGSAEILKHGLDLLKKDTDTNRRLAMISIDNAVELMIKTYLGLPKRVTGLNISRSEFQEFAENFTKLLDAIEKHANAKLGGIDLGEIEWYHRLRNQLYHQGNGLTVERDKVQVYAELANILFENLFGFRLVGTQNDDTPMLGEFMQAWVNLELAMSDAAKVINVREVDREGRALATTRVMEVISKAYFLTPKELEEVNKIRVIRNNVVHGTVNFREVIKPDIVQKLVSITSNLKERVRLHLEKVK